MQEGLYKQRLARAKELLTIVRHAALATVNEDGSPHNTPVFATFDEYLNFYWASDKNAQHSKNVARDGRVFVVLFDSLQKGGGLYVQAKAHELKGEDVKVGLEAVNATRARWGRPPVSALLYRGDSPQRLYCADIQKAWVNITEYDEAGQVRKEIRREVTVQDLLQ